MPKKKSVAVAVAAANTTENTRAALLAVIPETLPLDPGAIADEVLSFRDEAEKALAVAQRADVNGADPAGRAGDVMRAISAARARLDSSRKKRTVVLDDLKSNVKKFYDTVDAIYSSAAATLRGKIDVWRRDEEARLTREAEERRKTREAEAAKLATAQAALGDAEGAQQILEEAAAISEEPEKVRAVGVYGTTVGSTTRNIGAVKDRSAFFKALATSKDPLVVDIANNLVFPQLLLNRLAKAVNESESLCPPGFVASTETNSSFR